MAAGLWPVLKSIASEQGEVKRDVYLQYLKAASLWGGIFYAVSTILQQGASIGTWARPFMNHSYFELSVDSGHLGSQKLGREQPLSPS